MKNMLKKVAVMVAAGTMMMTAAKADVYSQLFKVKEIDRKNDVATLVTCMGFEYQYDEPEDMEVDDFYSAVMDDNGTEEIFDDIIVSIRYERPDLF